MLDARPWFVPEPLPMTPAERAALEKAAAREKKFMMEQGAMNQCACQTSCNMNQCAVGSSKCPGAKPCTNLGAWTKTLVGWTGLLPPNTIQHCKPCSSSPPTSAGSSGFSRPLLRGHHLRYYPASLQPQLWQPARDARDGGGYRRIMYVRPKQIGNWRLRGAW